MGVVVVWTDNTAAFAGASIGVSNILRDDDDNEAYYGANVDVRQILRGYRPHVGALRLRAALAG
jgi:lipid-binding SYLF domain-containing protein